MDDTADHTTPKSRMMRGFCSAWSLVLRASSDCIAALHDSPLADRIHRNARQLDEARRTKHEAQRLCRYPLKGMHPLTALYTRMRLLFPIFATIFLSIAYADEPDTGGLDTEPGLRLRIYHIGHGMDPSLPLQPGQSPNVDFTVPKVEIAERVRFSDQQKVTDVPKEGIRDHYVAEWTGWIKAPVKGAYQFDVTTDAAFSLRVAEKATKAGIELEAGWHPIRLEQKVVESDSQPISLSWKKPGDAMKVIEPEFLRAPQFYFRPTQSGLKQLADGKARPGKGMKLAGVHPGYRLTNIRPNNMEMPVGGLGMLSDGRLVVARFDAQTLKGPNPTADPNGELWLISNPTSNDPTQITGEKIAEGLFEPSGLNVLNDEIYVSQRSELSKFSYNPKTKTWDKSAVASGWETNDFHQISAGLPWEPGPTKDHPGFFYMSRGAGLGKNRNPPNHASVWKIDLSKPAGENVEVLTGGHRTPNGLGMNTEGECFVIDNQGNWTPANEINHVQKGKFYGFYVRNQPPNAYPTPFQPDERDGATGVTPAAVLLPQDEIANSPTELLLFPKGHRFEGQMAMGDMRYGGLNRIHLEKVNGVWQGCAMRFTQGLEGGPNRIFFGPDGSLYVGSIGGRHAGTWYWINPKTRKPTFGGLERLTPTKEKVFEIDHMSATKDGFVLHFTQPIPKETLENPSSYELSQWTYKPTAGYGGRKIDPGPLHVTQAVASDDRMSVTLTVPDRKKGYCIKLTTDPVSDQGKAIWSADIWYTLNEIPE